MALDPKRREQLMDDLARRAAQMHLTAPAILFLEMHKPFAFIGAQMLWVGEPFLSLWLNQDSLHDVARLLEDPANVEQLIERLESAQSS